MGDILPFIKTDPNGNLQRGRVYSNPSLDDEFGGAQKELLVMKINSLGDLQWVRWIRHIRPDYVGWRFLGDANGCFLLR
jgi:hypothetical protein